jgi:hypothetical protein
MKRKAYIIGIMSLGLVAATAVRSSVAVNRVVSSAQNFEYYFKDLRGSRSSLSPIERVVFSLVLARTQTPAAASATSLPADRT